MHDTSFLSSWASFLPDLGTCQTVCHFRACICYSLCQEHTFLHLWPCWLLLGTGYPRGVTSPNKRGLSVVLELLSLLPELHVTSLHRNILCHFPPGTHLQGLFTSLSSGFHKERVPSLAMLNFPLILQYPQQGWAHGRGLTTRRIQDRTLYSFWVG